IQQFDRATLQRQAGLETSIPIGDEGLVDVSERKIAAVTFNQHGLALRSRQTNHGVTERRDVIDKTECREARDETVEVNFFGVEQRAVHVEQDGTEVPFAGHDAAARGVRYLLPQAIRA